MKLLPSGSAINTGGSGSGTGGTVFVSLPGVYLSEIEWKRICTLVENEWGWSQEEFLAYIQDGTHEL